MRLIKKILPIIALGLILMGFSSPINAETNPFSDLKFPDVNPPAWTAGQSATYNFAMGGLPEIGTMSMTMRMAIVGKETIEGKDYHWVELDMKDFKGLPEEASSFIQTLKIKLLTRYISTNSYQDDPKALLTEIANGNVIRKIVFQLNNDDPQFIDFMTIQGMVQGMTGQDIQSLIDDIPMDDAEAEGMPKDVKVDCGTETVKIATQVFNNAHWCTFSGSEEGNTFNGKVYSHESVPVTAFLKLMAKVHESKENLDMTMDMDLVSFMTTGAKSEIVGTPKPFDFSALMGPAMGMQGK